jgi:hypothetical protein
MLINLSRKFAKRICGTNRTTIRDSWFNSMSLAWSVFYDHNLTIVGTSGRKWETLTQKLCTLKEDAWVAVP